MLGSPGRMICILVISYSTIRVFLPINAISRKGRIHVDEDVLIDPTWGLLKKKAKRSHEGHGYMDFRVFS